MWYVVGFVVIVVAIGLISEWSKNSEIVDKQNREIDSLKKECTNLNIRILQKDKKINTLTEVVDNFNSLANDLKPIKIGKQTSTNKNTIDSEYEKLKDESLRIKDALDHSNSLISEKNKELFRLADQVYSVKQSNEMYNKLFGGLDLDTIQKASMLINETNVPYFSLASKKQLKNYIAKIEQNRAQRAKLAQSKPIITGAIENGILKDTDWIDGYKKECFAIQELNNLVPPSIPNEGAECQVIKNIDGDTLWVSIPSLNIDKIKVRVAGYDTPESHKPGHGIYHGAYEACELSDKLIASSKKITIRYDEEQKAQNWLFDKYGRLLAHIYLDDKHLGLSLIENGYAFYMEPFPLEKQLRVLFSAAEGHAKLNNIGMWDALNKLSNRELHNAKLNNFAKKYAELMNDEERIKNAMMIFLGAIVIKSKNSSVIHNPECRHLNRIKEENASNIKIDEENINKIVACKTCGSDLLKEII